MSPNGDRRRELRRLPRNARRLSSSSANLTAISTKSYDDFAIRSEVPTEFSSEQPTFVACTGESVGAAIVTTGTPISRASVVVVVPL